MDRSTNMRGRGYQRVIGAASLAVGPLVMAIGDLLHPQETSDISGQAAIIVEQRPAGTWPICCSLSAWCCLSRGC
jgi:hypothetical protein